MAAAVGTAGSDENAAAAAGADESAGFDYLEAVPALESLSSPRRFRCPHGGTLNWPR